MKCFMLAVHVAVLKGMLAAIFQTCAFYIPCATVVLGAAAGAVCLDCALHALIRILDRDLEEGKEWKKAHKMAGGLFLQVVGDMAWHSWEGDPGPWKQ